MLYNLLPEIVFEFKRLKQSFVQYVDIRASAVYRFLCCIDSDMCSLQSYAIFFHK